jgi:glycine cleavage system H lipoate-binding protein
MSTTFGVEIPSSKEVEEVARRVSGEVFFINPLAELLPDKTKVIAVDNSPQGIHNIGDLKSKIK